MASRTVQSPVDRYEKGGRISPARFFADTFISGLGASVAAFIATAAIVILFAALLAVIALLVVIASAALVSTKTAVANSVVSQIAISLLHA